MPIDVDTPHVVILLDGRMDRKNAALYLGLSVHTLAMYAVQRSGPRFIKRGRVWYRKADLDAWLDGAHSKSEPEDASCQ